MIFVQTAGYYFTGSLVLLAFSILIFTFSFHILMSFAQSVQLGISNEEACGFIDSQFKSVLLNCIVIIVIASFIIARGIFLISNPKDIDFILADKFLISASVIFFINLLILIKGLKEGKEYKPLFIRCLIIFIAVCIKIAGSYLIGNSFEADIFIGIFLSCIAIVESIVLIIKVLRANRRKIWQ
ncbi:MAG: hypothetical protein LBV66_00900 [Elusimicrobiota bacterium]|nr:hypothetical protein [Elusimicrobiota bacterium]